MITRKSWISSGAVVLASLFAFSAFAQDAVNSAKDAGSDVKRDTKKSTRTAKRKFRKATGQDTMGKDVKDKANDLGDDAKAASEKAQH